MKTIDFIYTRSFLLFFINIFWTTILPPSTLGHVDLFSKLYIKSHSIDVLQRNIPLIHRLTACSLKIFSLYEEYHSYITHVTAAYCPSCCSAAHVSRRVFFLLTSHNNCAFRDGTTYTCVHDVTPSLVTTCCRTCQDSTSAMPCLRDTCPAAACARPWLPDTDQTPAGCQYY